MVKLLWKTSLPKSVISSSSAATRRRISVRTLSAKQQSMINDHHGENNIQSKKSIHQSCRNFNTFSSSLSPRRFTNTTSFQTKYLYVGSKKKQNDISQKRMFSSGKEDFYKILGVKKGDDKGTIKKAYFKLAKQFHPDTNKVRRQTHCDSVFIL